MNTEQERAEFEAWYASRHETYDTTFIYYTPENRYQRPSVDESWSAYQAGRAALQSQDREDAERYRAIRRATARPAYDKYSQPTVILEFDTFEQKKAWMQAVENGSTLEEAIDHARRIEGDRE